MQEVFEDMVKTGVSMIDDAINHTDVVKLLKEIKLQKAIIESRSKLLEHEYNRIGSHDPVDDDLLETEILNLAGQVEFATYVIDVIESGKFACERKEINID